MALRGISALVWAARKGVLARLLLFLGLVSLLLPNGTAHGQDGAVYLVRIEGEIERGLAAYVKRVVATANKENSMAIVFRVNTPGGELGAALDIKDYILNSRVPTIALVDRQAFSAGALITIAAEEIYFVAGGVVGAATPITGTGEKASEKVVSAVRKDFAATAEARGRDPRIAEAMVDEDVAIADLVEAGKLLTLTAEEAVRWGYGIGFADSLQHLLEIKGLERAELIDTSPGLAERLVRFLTNPIVSSLLITLGFLGLLFELQTAGWGVGGTIGLIALGIFFWGHFLAGLAGWEGVALVALGIALLVVEMVFLPGFGIAGALGIAAFLAGLYVSLVGDFSSGDELLRAGYILAASFVLMVLGAWASLTYLPRTRSFGGLVLVASVQPRLAGSRLAAAAEGEETTQDLTGKIGQALTHLRPSGAAMIEGKRVDVVTEGEYILAGTSIEVVQDEGYRRVVKAHTQNTPGELI
ncbi:MAG: nodulation protein NfeD [Chloroflexi bacterium]|nr:nodulation protein NfeD [Chloroflexota bacterium]